MESEKEKMGTGRLYDANYDTELIAERQACKELCYTLNHLPPSQIAERGGHYPSVVLQDERTFSVGTAFFIVTMAITLRLVKISMPI